MFSKIIIEKTNKAPSVKNLPWISNWFRIEELYDKNFDYKDATSKELGEKL